MAAERPCNWYMVGKHTIECTNCADHRLANPDLGHQCKISRRKKVWRRYATHDRDDYEPTACDSCVSNGKAGACDVDTTLGYSCGKCLKIDCRVGGRLMERRPNLRQGFERWFRHACDTCDNRIAKRGEAGCSWLGDRKSWTRRCTRCENGKMSCWNGGILVAHPPEPNVPAAWTVSHTLNGGWAELRGGSPWRKNCINCAINNNHCRAMADAALAACNRCFQMGLDCVDAQGNSYPLPDLSRVGFGNFMPFRACSRCIAAKRNCDRQRPCDSCHMNGEAQLCDTFKRGDSANFNCHNGRLDPPPGPIYYLALGYGARGVNDPRDGSRLEHWIGPGFPVYSMEGGDRDKNRMAVVSIAEEMARAVRPQGAPPHGHRGGALENTRTGQISAQDLVRMLVNNWPGAEAPSHYAKYTEAVSSAREKRALLASNSLPGRRQTRRGTTRTPGPAVATPDANAAANADADADASGEAIDPNLAQVDPGQSRDAEAPNERAQLGGGPVKGDEAYDSDETLTDAGAQAGDEGSDDDDDDDDANDGSGGNGQGGRQGGNDGTGGSGQGGTRGGNDGGDPGSGGSHGQERHAPGLNDPLNAAGEPLNALANMDDAMRSSVIDPGLLANASGPEQEWQQQQPQQQAPAGDANEVHGVTNQQQGGPGRTSDSATQAGIFDLTDLLNLSPESIKALQEDINQNFLWTPEGLPSAMPGDSLNPELPLNPLGQDSARRLFGQGQPTTGLETQSVGTAPQPLSFFPSQEESVLLEEQLAQGSRVWTPPMDGLNNTSSQVPSGGAIDPNEIYQSPERRAGHAAEEAQNASGAVHDAPDAASGLQSTGGAAGEPSVATQQAQSGSDAPEPQNAGGPVDDTPNVASGPQSTSGAAGAPSVTTRQAQSSSNAAEQQPRLQTGAGATAGPVQGAPSAPRRVVCQFFFPPGGRLNRQQRSRAYEAGPLRPQQLPARLTGPGSPSSSSAQPPPAQTPNGQASDPQPPATASSTQGSLVRFGRWSGYITPENWNELNRVHIFSTAGSSNQARVTLFENSNPSVRRWNQVPLRDHLEKVPLMVEPASSAADPADGTRECDEPSLEGVGKCKHAITDDQVCASLDHPGPSGRGWGVCDPCAQDSADVVVGVKPGVRRVEPHELLGMRAYFCNGCAVSYGRNIGSLGRLLRHGARTVWGSGFADGLEVRGTLTVNDNPVHFHKDARPATGCACATKLFGRRLCREHRCFYVEKALAGVAAVRRWRDENLGGDRCAGCLLTMSPGQANVGDGRPGAYGQPVAWICMQCNDAVVNQTGPGLVPGWDSWFSQAPPGWAAANNRMPGDPEPMEG